MTTTQQYLDEVNKYSAKNYKPLPVVIEKGEGAWVWDVDGKKYLDCLSAYSALNQGHRHPAIVKAAKDQLDKVTLTSRAFHNDQMGPFVHALCTLTGFAKALPMNSGAEAVETALKAARKWATRSRASRRARPRSSPRPTTSTAGRSRSSRCPRTPSTRTASHR